MFSAEQLQTLGYLVIAAGKSPLTGHDGIVASAQALSWIAQALNSLQTQSPAAPAVKPVLQHPSSPSQSISQPQPAQAEGRGTSPQATPIA